MLVPSRSLPPTLLTSPNPETFYSQIALIFEAWVSRRDSLNTRRAYRADLMSFIGFMEWSWPSQANQLLHVSVVDVLAFREFLLAAQAAPKTINRRIASLSSFYKYLAAAAAELRLPINVPNPAHAQFISRSSTDPIRETAALSAAGARLLMALPAGDDLLAYRDRAILKTFLYTGARLGSVCNIDVDDFLFDGEHYSLRLLEKGNKRRTIGIHYAAALAIQEYIGQAQFTSGPLFRARSAPRSRSLSSTRMNEATLWRIVSVFLRQVPGPRYTPHSLRATTATLLLNAGEDIARVQQLLGHRNITTTQIYDKRRRATCDSASHKLPL